MAQQVEERLDVENAWERRSSGTRRRCYGALEVSEQPYCRWRNQYGGMKSEEANRSQALEDENRRLKQLVASLKGSQPMSADRE